MYSSVFYVLFDIPKLFCLFFLCVKFAYVLGKTIQKRAEKKKNGHVSIACCVSIGSP